MDNKKQDLMNMGKCQDLNSKPLMQTKFKNKIPLPQTQRKVLSPKQASILNNQFKIALPNKALTQYRRKILNLK